MGGNKVGVADRGKREAVEEEKCKDDYHGGENGPPQLLVHAFFGVLLAFSEVLEGKVERVERPDVKGSQRSGKREDNEEYKGAWICVRLRYHTFVHFFSYLRFQER